MKQDEKSAFSRREFIGLAGAAAGLAAVAAIGFDEEKQPNIPAIDPDAFIQKRTKAMSLSLAAVSQGYLPRPRRKTPGLTFCW